MQGCEDCGRPVWSPLYGVCEECFRVRLTVFRVAMGWETPGFPVAGTVVRCGNRSDLFRKKRRHIWIPLGPDARNLGAGGIRDVEVRACARCGADSKE